MYQPYRDITDKLGEPKWWDEEGVSRYNKFKPGDVSDIYADYAALIEIICQGCNRFLPVAWSFNKHRFLCRVSSHPNEPIEDILPKMVFPTAESEGLLGYGDAPAHYDSKGQMCPGCTMTTEVKRILQFWSREHLDWERKKVLEFIY